MKKIINHILFFTFYIGMSYVSYILAGKFLADKGLIIIQIMFGVMMMALMIAIASLLRISLGKYTPFYFSLRLYIPFQQP